MFVHFTVVLTGTEILLGLNPGAVMLTIETFVVPLAGQATIWTVETGAGGAELLP